MTSHNQTHIVRVLYVCIILILSSTIAVLSAGALNIPATIALLVCTPAILALFGSARIALCVLSISLPLYGNRPGSLQSQLFLLTCCLLLIALIVRHFTYYVRTSCKARSSLALWIPCAMVICACLSLFPIPTFSFLYEFRSQVPSLMDLRALENFLCSILFASEDSTLYPVVSVLWITIASSIGWITYLECVRNRSLVRWLAVSILIGLILSMAAGALDYLSVIDLRALRSLDPVVNPGDTQFRMQSFFGHSGWFAEYVTLCAPFTMVILLLPVHFWIRLTLVLATLIAGELVLILSFQRGGWLSYPLTLCTVWIAIYVMRQLECGQVDFRQAFRRSVVKVMVSIPLTLLLSISIIWAGMRLGVLQESELFQPSRYISRVKEIAKTSDRTEFIRAGFLIGSLHPFFGAGNESFASQYRKEFLRPEGRLFSEQIVLPLHGSAHNVFMQTFAGRGGVGLLLLLYYLGYLIVTSLRSVLQDQSSSHDRILLLIVACFAAAFLIYGNVQEIFYIQSLQVLFFLVAGMAGAILGSQTAPSSPLIVTVNYCLLGLFIVHIWWEYRYSMSDEDRSYGMEYGCFQGERDERNDLFSWCGVRARQGLQLDSESDTVSFFVLPARDTVIGGEQLFTVSLGNQTVFQKQLEPNIKHFVTFAVPAQLTPLIYNNAHGRAVRAKLALGSYLIPSQDLKHSLDRRLLSFRLYKE